MDELALRKCLVLLVCEFGEFDNRAADGVEEVYNVEDEIELLLIALLCMDRPQLELFGDVVRMLEEVFAELDALLAIQWRNVVSLPL